MKWFKRNNAMQGWLAVSIAPSAVSFVHGRSAGSGKPAMALYGARPLDAAGSIERVARELHFERYQCATLLRAGEYQLLSVEAPKVPADELKSAIRWRIKDMIDYHVDDAAIDVLDVPVEEGARAHAMYAVSARNEVIQGCVRRFEKARIALSVIDIPETAQRNLAALYEEEGRGVALLHFDEEGGLLTINFCTELYLARRIDVGLKQFRAEALRENAFNRALLELQRTFDHFERQYGFVTVARLLLGPCAEDFGLEAFLAGNVGMPVRRVDLGERLAFNGQGAPDAAAQSRLFHLFGAALRHEAKVL